MDNFGGQRRKVLITIDHDGKKKKENKRKEQKGQDSKSVTIIMIRKGTGEHASTSSFSVRCVITRGRSYTRWRLTL